MANVNFEYYMYIKFFLKVFTPLTHWKNQPSKVLIDKTVEYKMLLIAPI